MKKAFICLLLAAIAVSAQQKQRIAVLPSVGDLEPQGLIILTDKVREIATKNLPIDNFTILKQDVIINMIGEEELYRSCKEGVCIGDLAKKTNANYGARCDVMKFDNSLVLKFELYSVNEEAIFETFTDIDVKDFRGMIASLEKRLPDVFKKMASASASKSREVTSKPEPAKPESPSTTLPRVQAGIPTPTKTTFTDSRDGKVYRKVTIGSQTWMAENLNYNANGSKCYGKDGKVIIGLDKNYNSITKRISAAEVQSNCEKYGRLYNWSTAKGACPAGWHLPSDTEWKTLLDYTGGLETAGTKLKSSTGWNSSSGVPVGMDDYGFSTLPGGGSSNDSFEYAGESGFWWGVTEASVCCARALSMSNDMENVYWGNDSKTNLFSVRCVQDP